EKTYPQDVRGVFRVFVAAGQVIRQAQRRNDAGEAAQIVVISNAVDLWIPFAVAADVWSPTGFVRVWPPIRRLAHVVVLVSARWRHALVHDRDRAEREPLARLFLERGGRPFQVRAAAGNPVGRPGEMGTVEQEKGARPGRLHSAGRDEQSGNSCYNERDRRSHFYP